MKLLRTLSEFIHLPRKVRKIMADLTELQNEMAALRGKIDETRGTLSGLVDRIIALENAGDQQEAINALVAEAKSMREDLDAAEDAADDKLPPPTGE